MAEETDLSKVEPEKTAELRAILRTWREQVGARMMEPNPQYADDQSPWD